MNEPPIPQPSALVDADWLERHRADADIKLLEIHRWTRDTAPPEHIPGAIRANWKDLLWHPTMREFAPPEIFAQRMGALGIGNDTTVVLYGEPVQYGTYAWWVLRYCGHARTLMLDGGHRRWSAEGRTLSRAAEFAPPETRYEPRARVETMRATRDDVLKALDDRDTLILDVRSPQEYRGEAVGPPGTDHGAERHGRIPGARHRHYADLLTADERFKPVEELRALMRESGVSPDRRIVLYCRLSHRASLVYFALTQLLGYPRVHVYDGSWTEWGSIVGVPIER
jgi:thiosulfate/3-mercaptopyruvate sulfurtransferase